MQTGIDCQTEEERNKIKPNACICRHKDKLTQKEILAPGTGNTMWTTDSKGGLQITNWRI